MQGIKHIIHIGLPKCGSTFIQKKIFNNIESHKFKYCLNLKKYDSVIKSHINKLKNNLSINELAKEFEFFFCR